MYYLLKTYQILYYYNNNIRKLVYNLCKVKLNSIYFTFNYNKPNYINKARPKTFYAFDAQEQ